MISHRDMLNIIATEAVEAYSRTYEARAKRLRARKRRIKRYGASEMKNGAVKWQDD